MIRLLTLTMLSWCFSCCFFGNIHMSGYRIACISTNLVVFPQRTGFKMPITSNQLNHPYTALPAKKSRNPEPIFSSIGYHDSNRTFHTDKVAQQPRSSHHQEVPYYPVAPSTHKPQAFPLHAIGQPKTAYSSFTWNSTSPQLPCQWIEQRTKGHFNIKVR